MSRLTLLILVWVLAALAAGCGGGGEISGDRIPIYGVPGTGGDKFAELSPAVTKPPAEAYNDYSAAGDAPEVRWLKNCYATLPPLSNATSVYQNASIRTWSDLVFAGVNANRASGGRAALTRNVYLDAIAQAQARDMALRNYFDHTNPEQMTSLERLLAVNPPRFDHLGETAAKGQESPQEVAVEWFNSEKHYKISMDAAYNYAGVGVYCDINDTTMPMHIIMVFAQFIGDVDSYTGWVDPGPQ